MRTVSPIAPARHKTGLAGTAILLLALANPAAWAQAPRTIKIVVPFAAGGPSDTTSRVLAEQIGRAQGVSVVVESRPGAASAIATEAVARAVPDGGTLLITASALLINPILKKMNYDPLTGFEPLCRLVRSPHFIVVHKDSPLRTLADLVGAARAKPGELTLGTVGPATGPHIAFETLKRRAGADITFVPFPGTAPAITSLLGGHITVALADFRDVIGPVKSGALRALVTTSRERLEALPDVPTVAESGYPGYEAESWFGLFAPARTPPDTVNQLIGWLKAAMQDAEVRAKLVNLGLFPLDECGTQFSAYLREHYDEYVKIVREAGIKVE